MLEFTMILPVFFMIVGGIIDFGWVSFHQGILESAASRGCRESALVDPGVDDVDVALVTDLAESEMLAGLGASCDGCTATAIVVGTTPGRMVTCSVTNHYDPLFGVTTAGTLGAQTSRRLEWQR